jgi:hypothetical protein
MADTVRLSGERCCDNRFFDRIDIVEPLSAITTGSTLQLQNQEGIFCMNVLTVEVGPYGVNHTLLDVFTTCEECLSGTSNAVQIETCNGQNNYFVDINSFTTLPTIGDIYYINITRNNKLVEDCFTIVCYKNTEEPLFNVISISDPYTGCTECYVNNFQVWEVIDCFGVNTYYVSLPPNNDYTNYIITFELVFGEQICGTVTQVNIFAEPDVTLISILGLSTEVEGGTVSCEDCLSISSEKRIIVNCLNSDNTQVVWGSVFYEGSEVTNLSTEDGCFEVGDLTESAVTINTFLNYDPQPNCQECIQCEGLYYTYSSCTNSGPVFSIDEFTPLPTSLGDGFYGPFTGITDGNGVGFGLYITVSEGQIVGSTFDVGVGYQVGDTITISSELVGTESDLVITVSEVTTTGVVFSYQYVEDSIGKSFYIPYLDDCVEITNISNIGSPNFFILSFEVFDNCTSCLLNNDFYVWLAEECNTLNQNVVVLNSNSFNIGDYVKVLRGSTEFQCHRLINPYVYDTSNYTTYLSNSVTPFSDCETCNSGTLIGASIAKCGGGGQQFVNIPINTWNQMEYLDSQSIFVLEQYGQCYGLLNACPLEPNYTTIYPIETYYNCITCLDDNTRFPRSANTETFLCQEICTSGGTTTISVTPPHPVWTDGYGTEVTQLNMITLGGINGLNN